ncbi:hypothetical protein [Lysinibacter cavernae]|uniref:Uncharacterized protein n=1 Tax=Lysinibacter cavernae TaxID=1640652 RepID=A0A7X5QZB4_9MICO|nr:hypothetical protein [Lysinibacter cavernae]NIH52562.1 hypothetical protein [Lysinibacter cavernae]
MPDIETLDDFVLASLLNKIVEEQARRQRLSAIPVQVADLQKQFLADGGDPAELA